ncbi:MAG: glycosyltransferase family 2 protein [Candidatus Omnitrophica bacterium]|nr:glycosyltransferase family 2 protein [Candidatus Omnitrophota bacterium]
MKTTLLVLTLNEIDGMKQIMPQIKREWVDEIFVVDGRSTDGTAEYAMKNGYSVIVQKKPGIRNAYIEALGRITGDVIIPFSPDGNCKPEVIPQLVKKMEEGYDMVIASRYLKDARSYDDSLITSFGNWMFTSLINVLHGGKYTDAMNMFRAFKKELIRDLELDRDENYSREEALFHTKICIMPLLSVRAAKRKLRITEIPADEPRRLWGKRKLQIVRWGSAYLTQVLKEVFVWR